MRRRRILISVCLVVGFLVAVALGLVALVKREPAFYRQAEVAPGESRAAMSRSALSQFSQLKNALTYDPEWQATFSADEINAYFQEDFLKVGADDNLPEDFHAPRVQIEDGRIRIGVRYGSGLWSTILSIELKAWLIPGETNMIGVEVVGLRTGALPLSASTLLDYISQGARRQGIDVTWYRNDGHPVAVMRYQADVARPTLLFERLDLADGSVTLRGRLADAVGAQPIKPIVKGP